MDRSGHCPCSFNRTSEQPSFCLPAACPWGKEARRVRFRWRRRPISARRHPWFSFLTSFLPLPRNSARRAEPFSVSSTEPSTAPLVTADVTAVMTALMTADVTADVAASIASTIASSRVMAHWAEPKPFPAYRDPEPGGVVQVWPVNDIWPRLPTAEQLAKELLAAMQLQPTVAGRRVLAISIETVIYPAVCHQLGWPPRPWRGKKGVARYLAALLSRPPSYRCAETGGVKHELQHYFIPSPQMATVTPTASVVELAEEKRRRA
jgi:hypothetical protein